MYKIDGECVLLPQNDELIHVRWKRFSHTNICRQMAPAMPQFPFSNASSVKCEKHLNRMIGQVSTFLTVKNESLSCSVRSFAEFILWVSEYNSPCGGWDVRCYSNKCIVIEYATFEILTFICTLWFSGQSKQCLFGQREFFCRRWAGQIKEGK